jgi:hypothetical protein
MFHQIRQWWRARAIQQLNRDAREIIRRDSAAYTDRHLTTIANVLRTYLAEFDSPLQTAAHRREVAMRLKSRHREARRRHDQVVLSAATLTIIYRRAMEVGETAAPARDAVQAFLDRYADSEGVTADG